MNVFGSYSTFYKRVDLDEIDSYESILGVKSYELEGKMYDNILEVATNTDSTEVEKFWIQKGNGIIKLWYKNKLWSVNSVIYSRYIMDIGTVILILNLMGIT